MTSTLKLSLNDGVLSVDYLSSDDPRNPQRNRVHHRLGFATQQMAADFRKNGF
jgi:hypothetical protein